jgi:hypothetical protein
MSAMKKFSIGPTALTASAANYLNPPAASGGVGITSAQCALVYSVTFVNTDTAAHTVSAYKGATAGSAAGTEIIPPATSVPASSEYVAQFYPPLRFESADFLSALADAASKVNVIIAGEVGTTG